MTRPKELLTPIKWMKLDLSDGAVPESRTRDQRRSHPIQTVKETQNYHLLKRHCAIALRGCNLVGTAILEGKGFWSSLVPRDNATDKSYKLTTEPTNTHTPRRCACETRPIIHWEEMREVSWRNEGRVKASDGHPQWGVQVVCDYSPRSDRVEIRLSVKKIRCPHP